MCVMLSWVYIFDRKWKRPMRWSHLWKGRITKKWERIMSVLFVKRRSATRMDLSAIFGSLTSRRNRSNVTSATADSDTRTFYWSTRIYTLESSRMLARCVTRDLLLAPTLSSIEWHTENLTAVIFVIKSLTEMINFSATCWLIPEAYCSAVRADLPPLPRRSWAAILWTHIRRRWWTHATETGPLSMTLQLKAWTWERRPTRDHFLP